MTGADLQPEVGVYSMEHAELRSYAANIMNETAIFSARRKLESITEDDIYDGYSYMPLIHKLPKQQ